MDELIKLSEAEKALQVATTPQQSQNVEAVAAAAIAWAKEQEDYELAVNATRVYFLARRKTTELIEPNIRPPELGRPNMGNNNVTLLEDYGFTKMQWSRRTKELAIPQEVVDEYLDKCIEVYAVPTVGGMCAFSDKLAKEKEEPQGRFLTPHQQAKELALSLICGAIDEHDKDWLLSDDCKDYFEELNLPYDFTYAWAEMGCVTIEELLRRILTKRLKENECPKIL
jgi:hypothetical protein